MRILILLPLLGTLPGICTERGASFAGIAQASCATANDRDCDGILDELEERLAFKFAPLFYFDSQETGLISSVEWYFDEVNRERDQREFLSKVDASLERPFNQGDWSGESWKGYVHVRWSPIEEAEWDIQYWFFYPFIGSSPREVGGTWRHITVTLNRDESIRSVFYGERENEGTRYVSGQFFVIDDTHTIAFVAKGSHAHYPNPGTHNRGVLEDDYHDGQGVLIDFRNLVENIGERRKPLRGDFEWLYDQLRSEPILRSKNADPAGREPYLSILGIIKSDDWDGCDDCPNGGEVKAACTPINNAYISHFTGPSCFGEEHYYIPYFGYDGIRRSWDGKGCAENTLRTVTNRSYKNSSGACITAWPSGNTLSNFVKIRRICTPIQNAYISHFTGPDCSGEENYYTPYFGNDGIRRSWDGSGCAGTTVYTVTNKSYKTSSGVCNNAWPSGNTLSGFVKIYRDCTPIQNAYISHFTGSNCTGEEHYYTPYFGSDGIRRSWDGKGCASTALYTVTNKSYKNSSGVCNNAWPTGNTLSGFVKIYR